MRARLTVETGDCLPAAVDLSPGQPVTLGRSRDNTVVVRDELASRLHAKIYYEDGRWHLRDFGLNGNVGYDRFATFGNRMAFSAYEPTAGSELWVTDGSPSGTSVLWSMRRCVGVASS